MSGLLRRIRRSGAAEETRSEPTTLPSPGSAPANPATGEDGQRLPAGTAPEDVERREVSGRRGKLRRRARYLHKARELALRDLGGLVYEARRREQDPGKLAQEKVDRLAALDAELTEIEATLGATRGQTVVREPGIGGTCARCGELHPSDATFCARCGANLAEAAREEAERRAAAEKAAAERKAAEQKAAEEQKAGTEQPKTAHDAGAEQPTEGHDAQGAREGAANAPERDGSGNGHIDSEQPTEVAEPAASRDRSA